MSSNFLKVNPKSRYAYPCLKGNAAVTCRKVRLIAECPSTVPPLLIIVGVPSSVYQHLQYVHDVQCSSTLQSNNTITIRDRSQRGFSSWDCSRRVFCSSRVPHCTFIVYLSIRGFWARGTGACILDVRVTDTDAKSYCKRPPTKVLESQQKEKKRK